MSLFAGTSSISNERLVPNAVDIVENFDTLAYYWQGGLGVESTQAGGSLSIGGAVLALVHNSLATMLRLTIGLALGIASATLVAALIGWSRTVRRMLLLPANAARMMPLLAMSPLFGLWFGNSERGAILFVGFAAFAIVFIVALTAISNVPSYYENSARSLGASRLRAYATVVLPAALPSARGGVMLALGFGWSMVIAAEFLGQEVGLGNIVNQAQQFGRTNTLAVLGVLVVIYAAISYWLMGRAYDRLVQWAE